jgi:type I restriction enzyme S subunit
MKSNYSELGQYIREVNERNSGLEITNLLGVSMEKTFIKSVANINGVDMSVYKVIRSEQLACKLMSVGRDEKLPVDIYKDLEPSIVSSAYYVFEPKDKEELLPEYLMMWLCRKENDRYIGFISGGDVRGGISWETFCSLPIKVPSITKQREIVKEYNVIQNRITLNQQLIQKLEETAQAIYREWFVEFEFPDKDSKPYKSNGGEMINSELGEIPLNWEVGTLFDLLELQRGFDLPTQNRKEGTYPIFASTGTNEKHNEFKVKAPGIVTGRSGSLGEVFYVDEDFWPLNTTLWVKHFKRATPIYSYYVLKGINIIDYNGGSAVPTLNRNDIHRHQLIVPEKMVVEKFESIQQSFFKNVKVLNLENQKLIYLKELLLSRLATV